MNQKFIIHGGKPLRGTIELSGAKNVASKALAACLLTDEEVLLENIPHISSMDFMLRIANEIGADAHFVKPHTIKVKTTNLTSVKINLDVGVYLRTSIMFIAPLLARTGKAIIPNPGGCRIGARPIDRIIEGLQQMGAEINYNHNDGYFYAKARELHGTVYRFPKNSHMGTETMILAAVLAKGETILDNAAEEPEIDDLIRLLNSMGASIKRSQPRKIIIHGVNKLHGVQFKIMPDRNEAVTLAIAAYISQGDIVITSAQRANLKPFLDKLDQAHAPWESLDEDTTRFFYTKRLIPTDIITAPHPGFMTDWQAPWCLLMTQAQGISTIHETVFEDRFEYVKQLKKLGADIRLFNPEVKNPHEIYNFNWEDNRPEYYHAAKIKGPSKLHNGVLTISDLRAGATLVLAALAAKGESTLYGIDHIDRGYEDLDRRLNTLGADIERLKE